MWIHERCREHSKVSRNIQISILTTNCFKITWIQCKLTGMWHFYLFSPVVSNTEKEDTCYVHVISILDHSDKKQTHDLLERFLYHVTDSSLHVPLASVKSKMGSLQALLSKGVFDDIFDWLCSKTYIRHLVFLKATQNLL